MNLWQYILQQHDEGRGYRPIATHLNETYQADPPITGAEVWRYIEHRRRSRNLKKLAHKVKDPRHRIELPCRSKQERQELVRIFNRLGGRAKAAHQLANGELIITTRNLPRF